MERAGGPRVCAHAAATAENAERAIASELQFEQEYLRRARQDADHLLEHLYNDSLLGKHLLRERTDWEYTQPVAKRVNEHNDLHCVVDICRNILFAAPPEGADADLSEAELQREEIIRHHRLLHNAGISFPDPNVLERSRRSHMDSDAEEILSEYVVMKKQKLQEVKSTIAKRIKADIRLGDPAPLGAEARPEDAAAPAAGAPELTATNVLQTLLNPALVAAAEHSAKREEKKRKKKEKKRDEEEKSEDSKPEQPKPAEETSAPPPSKPKSSPLKTPPPLTPPSKAKDHPDVPMPGKSAKEKAPSPKDDSGGSKAKSPTPPVLPTPAKGAEKKGEVETVAAKPADAKGGELKNRAAKFEFPKLKKRVAAPTPNGATDRDSVKSDASNEQAVPKKGQAVPGKGPAQRNGDSDGQKTTISDKKKADGLVRRIAEKAEGAKDGKPGAQFKAKLKAKAKLPGADAPLKSMSVESPPGLLPGRSTIKPGDPRPVIMRTKEEAQQVAEESKKAAKAATLKVSLKLIGTDVKRSGQITGSKPPPTVTTKPPGL